MCLKLKEEITNPFALINLINGDFGIAFELSLFTSNIKKEVCGALDFFYKENMKKEKLTKCCF
jgi:hypothetical protein